MVFRGGLTACQAGKLAYMGRLQSQIRMNARSLTVTIQREKYSFLEGGGFCAPMYHRRQYHESFRTVNH